MSTTLVERIEPPKTLAEPRLIPADRAKPLVARGFQMDNSIDLWVCSYEGRVQLSAFVYPTEFVIQYKMPLIDRNFSDFEVRKITREFSEIPVEELNGRFKVETGTATLMSHPIGLECYLHSGKKVFEHSFALKAADYITKIIREMK